jgi:hypothetical protein
VSEADPPSDAIDADEARAAAALARALDGRAGKSDASDDVLETAALLRSSGQGGQLSGAARARIRQDVLASLPRSSSSRATRPLPRWLAWGLPLLAGAAAALVVSIQGVREAAVRDATRLAEAPTPGAAPDHAAAADSTQGLGSLKQEAAVPREQLARAARSYRAELLPRLKDPRFEETHALVDRASSPEQLVDAEQRLTTLSTVASSSGISPSDSRLARQDIFCRLAEVALRLGQAEAALEWTRQGLALDGPPTPFLAQLSLLEGEAHHGLGDELAAARSYMKALRVNEALLDESLEGQRDGETTP